MQLKQTSLKNSKAPEFNVNVSRDILSAQQLRTQNVIRHDTINVSGTFDLKQHLAAKKDDCFLGLLEPTSPPLSNTGGNFEKSTDQDLLVKYKTANNDTTVDWLRASTQTRDSFDAFMSDASDILELAGFDLRDSGKGYLGYTTSYMISVWQDNDYQAVGKLACSDFGKQGGLFELFGTGCKIMQSVYPELWIELYQLLIYHNFRLTRTDIALDLFDDFLDTKGGAITIPRLYVAAQQGLFLHDDVCNPDLKQSLSQAGDWSQFIVGVLSIDDYNPLVHCPKGLTFYVGNRKHSDDFIRFYEKGKQLCGLLHDNDYIDRKWIRIEQEMSRKGSGRTIPLDVMIYPDKYFLSGRSGGRKILDDVKNHYKKQIVKHEKTKALKKEKKLLLSKKIHWAKRQYGRLLRTLRSYGYTIDEIFNSLVSQCGIKEFIADTALNKRGLIDKIQLNQQFNLT